MKPDRIISITFAKINFQCPYCEKPYKDDEDVYLNLCNTNKSGCTTIKCECEMRFGMTYDITGKAVSFKIEKKIMENQLKATELRLGNYVEYDNRIFKIDTLAEEFPTLDTDEFGIGVVDWNNINAIPLSEDILLRLGFEKKADWLFVGEKLAIEYITSEKLYAIRLILKPTSVLLTKIKHTHQLQNLFFALTGEELTFKN